MEWLLTHRRKEDKVKMGLRSSTVEVILTAPLLRSRLNIFILLGSRSVCDLCCHPVSYFFAENLRFVLHYLTQKTHEGTRLESDTHLVHKSTYPTTWI